MLIKMSECSVKSEFDNLEDFLPFKYDNIDNESSQCYDETDEEITLKCGEIVFSDAKFGFTCTFCNILTRNIPDFFRHILNTHMIFLKDELDSVDKLIMDLMAENTRSHKDINKKCRNKNPIPSESQSNNSEDKQRQDFATDEMLQVEKIDVLDSSEDESSVEELEVKVELQSSGEEIYNENEFSDWDDKSDSLHVNKTYNTDYEISTLLDSNNEQSEGSPKVSKIEIDFIENEYLADNCNFGRIMEIERVDVMANINEEGLLEENDEENGNIENSYQQNNNSKKVKTYFENVCKVCNKSFIKLSGLQRHLRTHVNSKIKEFKCNKCEKAFKTKFHLDSHLKRHLNIRPYPCNICGVAFADPSNLKVHIMRHQGIKPHHCTICDKSFHSTTELKLHVRAHTGEKPYVCEVCGKKFSNSGHLVSHKRRHFNDRRYSCDVCGKKFYDMKLLRDHSISHTSERPFECAECHSTFQRRKALIQHCQLHSDIRRYTCTICYKSFAQNAGLYSHMKTHTSGGNRNTKNNKERI